MASAPPLPEPDRLDRLVTVLDAACAEGGWHQPHRVVSVEPDPEGDPRAFAFGFRTLEEGQHPLELLLGFVAPAPWTALGVVCFGWAAPGDVDPARHSITGVRPSLHPRRLRVRVTTIVDRRGRKRATAALEDGTVVDEAGEGTVTDALLRALRVATAGPPVPTSELFAAIWLAELAATGRPLSWPEAALLHPALRVRAATFPKPQPEELISCGRSMHRALTWEKLRQRAADGRFDAGPDIDEELARWMDDGMFARWVLGRMTPLPRLLGECAAVLRPDVVRRIRRTLRAWNLDPPLAEVA